MTRFDLFRMTTPRNRTLLFRPDWSQKLNLLAPNFETAIAAVRWPKPRQPTWPWFVIQGDHSARLYLGNGQWDEVPCADITAQWTRT